METNQAGMPRGWTMLPTADSLDSTNTWLKTHAEGCADRSVLIAREQTAGRGRNGRVFHSAKDRGLYLSILLKQEQSTAQLNKVTALSALALQRAVMESCGLLTQIKWVNDLYCRGYKIAGILCEALRTKERTEALIIGFGVNVFSQDFPDMTGNQPGAIADFSPAPPSMDLLISALLRQIDDCLRHLDDPRYMHAYRACSCVINQPILVKEPHGTYEAFAEDIDEQGRLLIRCGSEKKYLCSGEISIRPISSR